MSANLRGNWFLAVRLNLALQRLEVSSGYRLSNPKEMDFFFIRRLRDDPQAYINAVLRHIGPTTPWALPTKFMKTKVHATNSIVAHNREIPEVVEWYIADRLLEPVERLNELLEGRVSSWVDEMRTIRGKHD